jgi:hypothetical protein
MRAGESIFIDFQKKDSGEIATSMQASYDLLSNSGSVLTGTLSKSGDNFTFELRIPGTGTASLSEGVYTLLVKVYDDTTGYADYIYEESVKIRS